MMDIRQVQFWLTWPFVYVLRRTSAGSARDLYRQQRYAQDVCHRPFEKAVSSFAQTCELDGRSACVRPVPVGACSHCVFDAEKSIRSSFVLYEMPHQVEVPLSS